MLLRRYFSKKWFLTTIIVFAGTTLCIRLGVWQLNRLEQRRQFNAQVRSMRLENPLDLNLGVPENIRAMEWRSIIVQGEYDFESQMALRNQYNGTDFGYHLLTPLRFNGMAVIIDRGWIPGAENSSPDNWRQYDETGSVTVKGQIRLGQSKPPLGGIVDALPADGSALLLWNNLDLEMMTVQIPYPILSVYIQPDPVPNDEPPIAFQPTVELTEGPHLGYALQWFTFAVILFAGYPIYLRKQE